MRVVPLCCLVLAAAHTVSAQPSGEPPRPLAILDVPFVSQSELLCGGAAAAMVLRYWGERDVSAETFAHLVDRSAAGIRTDALVAELRRRGWITRETEGDESAVRRELAAARPVLLLIEDRPSAFHYVVVVAWHERGVVFHDPARSPFRVMSTGELMRRWRAGRRWMAVVQPGSGVPTDRAATAISANRRPPDRLSPIPECAQRLADAVRLAQAQRFGEAERVLAEAVSCPGAARELAGIRVLQKRWTEAEDLASAATVADRTDTHAWRVLATSRFVQDDRLGALEAWNAVGEPRVDLVRVDGLSRTRHRVVERLLGVRPGELLTPARFTRLRRRLEALPAATSTRLEYVPVSSGLAEIRGAVTERPLVPRGRAALAATALAAAATREIRLTSGALAGGGEQLSLGYRFWPHRQGANAGLAAPAPWGGLWRVDARGERQPFTDAALPRAERTSARVAFSDWASGYLRWGVSAGMDAWTGQNVRGAVAGRLQVASAGDRVGVTAGAQTWPGRTGFSTIDVAARLRSSIDAGPRRTAPAHDVVVIAIATAQVASARVPLDLWPATDTGHARAPLARAHPLLDEGRLRVDRLGRTLLHASVEGRHWWSVSGPVRAAVAAFADAARTARRASGPPLLDVDAGIGGRLAVDGMPGVFRVDLAKGLRDGATAVSFGYEPWGLVVE